MKTEQQMKEEFRRWMRTRFTPLVGAEGDDDDGKGSGDDNSDDSDDNSADDGDDNSSDDDSSDNDSDDNDDDGDASSALAKAQKENKEFKDRLARADAAVIKAKKEASDARAEHAEKTGDYKKLASEREAQLKDAQEREVKLEEERQQAKTDLEAFQKQVRVVRIAQKLGYRDPEDAMAILESQERKLQAKGDESDLMGDDATTERTLRKLAEERKYLVDQKRRTGAPMNGNSNGAQLSMEQIKEMSTADVIARKAEVDAALKIHAGNTG